jgi:hypothetical protein
MLAASDRELVMLAGAAFHVTLKVGFCRVLCLLRRDEPPLTRSS